MFYDGGKKSASRTYIARIKRIIPKKKASKVFFRPHIISDLEKSASLYDIWKEACLQHDWYANDTDYFIECSIPNYDENYIWFVRSAYEGWWSLDIQNCWQHGSLEPADEVSGNCLYSI